MFTAVSSLSLFLSYLAEHRSTDGSCYCLLHSLSVAMSSCSVPKYLVDFHTSVPLHVSGKCWRRLGTTKCLLTMTLRKSVFGLSSCDPVVLVCGSSCLDVVTIKARFHFRLTSALTKGFGPKLGPPIKYGCL